MTMKLALIGLLGCIMPCAVQSTAPHLVRMTPYANDHDTTDPEEDSAALLAAGQASGVWKTFENKHIDPICSNHEFKHNFGSTDSLEECLDRVKASKLGNVGIWQRGLDKNCYTCDLHGRGKATSLALIDSEHIDAVVKFSGEHNLYSNDGFAFMRTPGMWRVKCFDLPNTTKYITTQYGARIDYFKPIVGEDFCTMMESNQHHLHSTTGADDSWNVPSYATGDQEFCGGNAGASAGVTGEIGTWCTMRIGQGDSVGGQIDGTFSHAFSMTYMTEYVTCEPFDGTGLSTVGYPCECGNTHCNSGEECNADTSTCSVYTGPTPAPAPTPAPSSNNPSPTPGPADETTTTVIAPAGQTTTTAGDLTTTSNKNRNIDEDELQNGARPPTNLFSTLSACVVMWLALS